MEGVPKETVKKILNLYTIASLIVGFGLGLNIMTLREFNEWISNYISGFIPIFIVTFGIILQLICFFKYKKEIKNIYISLHIKKK
jgi:uncharacterized membrane protein YczE